jgi:putative ABC transport system permease protein
MLGMFKIALKLLINDRAKFTALIVGITFAIFLIVQHPKPGWVERTV